MQNHAYWKSIVSMALRKLIDDRNDAAIRVIRKGELVVRHNSYDNWNGGIDYWDIVFAMKYRDFCDLGDRKKEVESALDTAISSFYNDETNQIANVIIEVAVERYVDWASILPETKASAIQMINEEYALLEKIATGHSYKEEGLEDQYRIRHQKICSIAQKAGFDYPIESNSLSEWWQYIKAIGSYSDRRAHISQLLQPVLNHLKQSEDHTTVDFSQIAAQSDTILHAISDAEIFIREEKYESAVDRIHTAFHGYLRQILEKHHVDYLADDSISALYSKLHNMYGTCIQPPDVSTRIRDIVRSGSGMVTRINELRNNNTIAHANTQLIQKREAELVIRMLSAIINYIDDIEQTLSTD